MAVNVSWKGLFFPFSTTLLLEGNTVGFRSEPSFVNIFRLLYFSSVRHCRWTSRKNLGFSCCEYITLDLKADRVPFFAITSRSFPTVSSGTYTCCHGMVTLSMLRIVV